MKTLIRTKDIASVEHRENHVIDTLCIRFTDGSSRTLSAEHYEESMTQRRRCKQLMQAYKDITEACKNEKEFVEFEID